MSITKTGIARDYAHRIAADPDTCPVCCGGECTDDPRYGSEVLYVINEGTHNEYPVFRCEACEVYHAPKPIWQMTDRELENVLESGDEDRIDEAYDEMDRRQHPHPSDLVDWTESDAMAAQSERLEMFMNEY